MKRTRWPSLSHAIAIAALGCTMHAAAWAQAPASQAPSSTAAASAIPGEPADVATIRKLLVQKFPGAEISHVAKSGYLGLYEVMLGDQLIYTDPKVTYVFVGSIYDTATKTNLTEVRSRKLNRVAVNKLPLDLAFKRVKGDGSRTIYLFSDADCPFCHRLEKEMQGLDNVTVYTFLFPIDQLHPDSARKSKILWCAPDRAKAWDAYFATGKLPDNKGDCGDPVAKTQALGASLHINATPTLIFADGTIIPGALPLPQLEKELASAQADLKKNGAAAR